MKAAYGTARRRGPRRVLRRIAVVLVAAAAGIAPGALRAAAAPAGPAVAAPGAPAAARSGQPHAVSSGALPYQGGPVQHASAVYLVFWGSQWNSDTNGVESYLQGLFTALGGAQDSWSPITSQYTDASGQGPTFDGPELHGVWADTAAAAPAGASAAQIAAEADRGATHFGVSGSDVQIFVISPSGTHPDGFPDTGFCAWHDDDGTVPYVNLPYLLDAGAMCAAGATQGPLGAFSLVGSAAYADILTDPVPGSGYATNAGQEIVDLCGSSPSGVLPGTSFPVPALWSNALNRCVSA